MSTDPTKYSVKALKSLADDAVIKSLVRCKFHENEWSFDPIYVRRLLQALFGIFAALSVYSVLIARMSYHWMFISFGTVLGALLWYWYTRIECGGGRLIFSPDWKDTFVATKCTETNYLILLDIGYTDQRTISIPFSTFKLRQGPRLSTKWLSREINERLNRHN